MLGVGGAGGAARTGSDWRRSTRGDRSPALGRKAVLDAGWHLSSFGGVDAVARKLEAYIEAPIYNTSFYTERARLQRLIDAGVGHFELVNAELGGGDKKYFACDADRTDVPAHALAHRGGHLAGLFQGSKRERNSKLQRLISRPFSTRFG